MSDRPAGGAPRGALVPVLLADFVLLGLSVGAPGVLWAEVVATLGIGVGEFGLAQLVPPVVAVGLLLRGGPLAARWGKRRLAVASLLGIGAGALALAAVLQLAASGGVWPLAAALAVLGAGMGLFEVAVNGAAMDWEGRTGRAVLNTLHAGYSAGAAAGAVGTGALLALGWRPEGVLLLLALLGVVLAGVTRAVPFPAPAPDTHPAGPGPQRGPRGLWWVLLPLAVAAALGSVAESVANLWPVIYLAQLGAGAALGGAAFALANGAMLAGRLANAPLVARYGPGASLGLSGAGLVLASGLLLLPGVPAAVAGFVLLGLAVAGVVPTVLGAAAGRAPGRSAEVAGGVMASVYVAFALSPPLVGLLAEGVGLRVAFLVVGLGGLGILALALTGRAAPPPRGGRYSR